MIVLFDYSCVCSVMSEMVTAVCISRTRKVGQITMLNIHLM